MREGVEEGRGKEDEGRGTEGKEAGRSEDGKGKGRENREREWKREEERLVKEERQGEKRKERERKNKEERREKIKEETKMEEGRASVTVNAPDTDIAEQRHYELRTISQTVDSLAGNHGIAFPRLARSCDADSRRLTILRLRSYDWSFFSLRIFSISRRRN